MPPPTTPTETPSKVKTTLVFLVMAMAMLFLLHTLYIRVKHDSKTICLVIVVNIIIFVCVHYKRNPDQIPHPPLFSFPSLSRPSRYRPLAGTIVDLPEAAVSVPSIVPPDLESDMVYDGRSTDDVVWERGEPSVSNSTEYWERGETSSRNSTEYWERGETSGRNSTEYWERGEPSGRIPTEYWERRELPVTNSTMCRDPETSNLTNERDDDDDQGSNGTLDDMWNNIVAKGKAKPVKLFNSGQREGNPKRETKKSTMDKRKEKKQDTESTSYDHIERRTRGRSTKATTGISSDELTHLADTFIRKHHNNLRIERQESNRRRLMKRLGFRDYRNAVSV